MHVHVFYMHTYKMTEYLWQILKFDTQSRSVFFLDQILRYVMVVLYDRLKKKSRDS